METIYSCRKNCCPLMGYDEEKNELIISDDFGNSVKLPPKEFEVLALAYDKRFGEGSHA